MVLTQDNWTLHLFPMLGSRQSTGYDSNEKGANFEQNAFCFQTRAKKILKLCHSRERLCFRAQWVWKVRPKEGWVGQDPPTLFLFPPPKHDSTSVRFPISGSFLTSTFLSSPSQSSGDLTSNSNPLTSLRITIFYLDYCSRLLTDHPAFVWPLSKLISALQQVWSFQNANVVISHLPFPVTLIPSNWV